MKKTPQLLNLLSAYKNTLTSDEYQSFTAEVDRLIQHYYDLLNSYKAGAERAQATHALIEEQIALNEHVKTSCQKGCGACCHLEVEITEDDADLMARSILSQSLDYDEGRLQQQASRHRLDPQWAQGTLKSNRCIMLGEDNACRNYLNRPGVCRKHSVVTPKEYCETLGASPIPRLIPMNEIILSAAVSLPQNNFGALPKLLAQALIRLKDIENIHHMEFTEEASPMAKLPEQNLE